MILRLSEKPVPIVREPRQFTEPGVVPNAPAIPFGVSSSRALGRGQEKMKPVGSTLGEQLYEFVSLALGDTIVAREVAQQERGPDHVVRQGTVA